MEMTAQEFKDAVIVMILNRIDEISVKMENYAKAGNFTNHNEQFARKKEAEFIIATCLDRFQPRRALIVNGIMEV